jgi:hypothetical protein
MLGLIRIPGKYNMSVKEVWTKLDMLRTKMSNSVAAKQKNRPGAAGEEAISYGARAISEGALRS